MVGHLDWLLQLVHVACLLTLDILFLSGDPDFKLMSLFIIGPWRDSILLPEFIERSLFIILTIFDRSFPVLKKLRELLLCEIGRDDLAFVLDVLSVAVAVEDVPDGATCLTFTQSVGDCPQSVRGSTVDVLIRPVC